MKSMTGFGRGAFSSEAFGVTVEIKTVNNRYLDIHLRLGQELSAIEMIVRKRVGARLSRGRVDLNINFDRTGAATYEVNRPLIAGYVQALREIKEELGLAGEIDVNSLARVPGALTAARDGFDEGNMAGLESALDQALDSLEQMRASEGAALAAEMRVRITKIEAEVPIIEAAAAGLADAYRQRLQKRVTELIARGSQAIELDSGRLAQEVAYLADRSDISEELARLRSHLEQFRSSIDADGEVGKRLDFLLQELNREANTVLSKSTEIAIKDSALAIKAEVEKLREQVQNVE
ncbi:MAG TPA: YicC/YloC family endoribonuclease [Pyrinomonadaceae bacterium]|nr:YicC/YloC family endoribonuclease [Pyrinomonadaceae bacterium]